MHLSKRDLVSALVTGLTTGLIVWRLVAYLKGESSIGGIPLVAAVVVVPLLWLAGVEFGYILGRWVRFFNQFGRYAAIGFTNAAVDFGVFNLLYATAGITLANHALFLTFKATSFIVASLHSYFWNKTWAFEAGSSRGGFREFITFFGVTLVSLAVNAGTAFLVALAYEPSLGISQPLWANVSLVVGSAVALAFSFIGFKILVFKK